MDGAGCEVGHHPPKRTDREKLHRWQCNVEHHVNDRSGGTRTVHYRSRIEPRRLPSFTH